MPVLSRCGALCPAQCPVPLPALCCPATGGRGPTVLKDNVCAVCTYQSLEHTSCTLYIYVIFCCFSFGCATALFFADRVSLLCQAPTPITLLCHFGLPGNHRVGCNMHLAHLSILCLLCGDDCVSALPSSHSQCFAESQEAPGSLGLVATGELSLYKEHHGSGSVVH